MSANSVKSPEEIRRIRAENPKMRERDFARIHGISEAELVAAHVGQGATRLRPDVATLLNGLEAVGEVMALTRNESAVHEKIGVYDRVVTNMRSALVLGEQIDLRIFPSLWASGFLVEKTDDDGRIKKSLQFFDAAGNAVHKVHTRPSSDMAAFEALAEQLRADDQSPVVVTEPVPDRTAVDDDAVPASADELRENWLQLTDTHQFFGMLKRLNLTRLQALDMIDDYYAWPLHLDATAQMMNAAAADGLPIMAFVGNPGCIQIHGGPIHKVSAMGPWLNVLDETFHLHLRLDHITQVWAVRKPTSAGHVTSVEAYGDDGKLIIQYFGKREDGHDERVAWRSLVEGLPPLGQTTAA